MSIFKAGQIALLKGLGNPFSELIAAKTASNFSHSVFILDDEGTIVDAKFPKVKLGNLSDYKDNHHRVAVLEYAYDLSNAKIKHMCKTALEKVGKWYDVGAYLGGIFNKEYFFLDDAWMCSEVVLDSFHSVGELVNIPLWRAEPKVFEILWWCGVFKTVYYSNKY